jgi:hypothetical protein
MARLVNLIPLVLVYINRETPAVAGVLSCREIFLPITMIL